MIALITGRALAWATASWQNRLTSHSTLQDFISELRATFEHSSGVGSSSLLRLCQGTRTEVDYTIDFPTLAAVSGWNDDFLQGLADYIKDELAARDLLDDLYVLAIQIDNRLSECHRERQGHMWKGLAF